MKTTELAEKRLKIISGDAKCRAEAIFIKKFVLEKEPSIEWCSGIHLIQVPEFGHRVHLLGGRVLGLHVSMDAPFNLISYPWEFFTSKYEPEWMYLALQRLQKNKIERFIVPTCEFDINILSIFQ